MTRTLTAAVALLALALAPRAAAQADPLPHVETRGTGDTHLVLVHNLQADWPVWASFMERNAARYTSHAVRLPGCGGSDFLERPAGEPIGPTPWTDAAASAIAGYLKQNDIQPAYAVGHGSGAAVATRLALDHPGLIKGVVAVDALPAYPVVHNGIPLTEEERREAVKNNFIKNIDYIALDEWRKDWPRMAAKQAKSEEHKELLEDLAKQVPYEAWRRWSIEYFSMDLTEEIKQAGLPYLSIGALNEPVLKFMRTRVMAEEFWRIQFDDLPSASVTLMDDTLHYIFLDRPEVFDEVLQRFINGEPQPPYAYVADGNERYVRSDALVDDETDDRADNQAGDRK